VSGPTSLHADRGQLLVVRVEDQINPTLAGRAGASYDSPPQPPEQARTLVRLLLGWATEPLDGQTHWRCAVAGGTRTVTLDTVETTGNVRGHDGHTARKASGESPVTGR
jgi:hypothetical protein